MLERDILAFVFYVIIRSREQKEPMRKLVVIMISAMLLFLLAGCKVDSPVKDQGVDRVTPTGIHKPTEEAEKSEKDDADLLPGFENWKASNALSALNKVLLMEETVTEVSAQTNHTEDTQPREYLLNNINYFLDYTFDQKMVPDRYAVVDMDHDGTPEVIVSLLVKEDSWILLLRYYEGTVYGYPFEIRSLESPKEDGTYIASSGASYNEIMQMSFDGTKLKEKRLANSGESEDVKWNLFQSDIRAGYNGKKLFRVDFDAITQPFSEDMKNYYTAQNGEMSFTYSNRIPKELCELILKAMKDKKEEETFEPLRTGIEMSQEDYCARTGTDLEVMESVTALSVDADNEGILDVVGQHYWGGTGGFCSMELYQGAAKDEYKQTNEFECVLQEYDFLSYQGKNYLLMKNYDYNTKYICGYSLYLYENGTLADGKDFSYDITDYGMNVAYEEASYEQINQIKNTLCNKKLAEVLDNNDGVIDGTAEIIDKADNVDYKYTCDIDNDGISEKYNKSMWYPSNMGTVMQCNYDFENSDVLKDLCERLTAEMGEGRLYTFWIDKINNKNIIYLYYGNNLDYSLYAYLLEKKQ
jgi:hypothetical protein